MKKLMFLIVMILYISVSASDKYIIDGYIFNQESGEVIPGASIQIPDKNYGTYSSASGHFRIPLPEGENRIKVSSMGYESQVIEVSKIDKSLKVFLIPVDLEFQNVKVTGEINADNIIKRAIVRKEENVEKLKNFTGELYSKFVIELNGNGIDLSTGGNSMSVSSELGTDNNENTQMFIMETFSDNYIDFENKRKRSVIKQRRQTSNIKPQDNLFVLSEFQSFYKDYFTLAETRIMNPLNENTFDRYDFQLLERTKYDDKYIYKVEVIPNTKIFPAFEGTISILEESYNLVEVDLTTSQYTSIPFVNNLHIYQKFDDIENNIWHPVYLNVTGDASVDLLIGLVGLKTQIVATSIYNNTKVNTNMPDSLFKIPKRITVSEGADSYDLDYWENNSLREISAEEMQVYEELGASGDASDSIKSCEDNSYYTAIGPYFDFNRVTSILPGIEVEIKYRDKYKLQTFAGYSFGQKEPVGSAVLNYEFLNNKNKFFNIYAGAFSEYNTLTSDKSINTLINTIFAAIYHDDYYDYYKNDGWHTGLNFRYKKFRTNLDYKLENQFSLNKTTDRSIFSKKKWRGNPEIIAGRYACTSLNLSYGQINDYYPGNEFNYQIDFNTMYGVNQENDNSFVTTEAEADLVIPTFNTGYVPMILRIKGKAGFVEDNTPIQYQFRMPTRLSIISGFGSMRTSPLALYGGTQYLSLHLEYNLTDLWWRALRLPRYEGRGVDLIVAASSAKYESYNNYSYIPTNGEFYSEVGFGLSRIPLFISNIAYLKTDFRWGIGPLAGGKFGWSVAIVLPI